MQVERFDIPGPALITPKKFGDQRGYFAEIYSQAKLREAGIDLSFVQDNQSLSAARGVVRGLHFQAPPHAQNKLVRVIRGRILDVAVDIRRGSPTYGEHVAVELDAEGMAQLLAPVGFAHGFVTLEPMTEVHYKVSDIYAPETEGGLIWSDPALGVAWPIEPSEAILSTRDREWPSLAEFDTPFQYEG